MVDVVTLTTNNYFQTTNPQAKLFILVTDPVERLLSHIQMQGRFRSLSGTDLDEYTEKLIGKIVDFLQLTNLTSEGMYKAVTCDNPATDSVLYLQ